MATLVKRHQHSCAPVTGPHNNRRAPRVPHVLLTSHSHSNLFLAKLLPVKTVQRRHSLQTDIGAVI